MPSLSLSLCVCVCDCVPACDDNILLPEERPSDEWAGIHATVRIQVLEGGDEVTNVYLGSTASLAMRNKRLRESAGSN